MNRKRSAPRQKRRLLCELETATQRKRGIVLNLSETGLFVQTMLVPSDDEDVVVHLENPDGSGTLLIRTRLARVRQVPAQLASISPRGLGLSIISAPAEYRELVCRDGVPQPSDLPAPPISSPVPKPARTLRPPSPLSPSPPEILRFRVRVAEIGSPRSRTLSVQARSEQEAALQVHEELGPEWTIQELVPE